MCGTIKKNKFSNDGQHNDTEWSIGACNDHDAISLCKLSIRTYSNYLFSVDLSFSFPLPVEISPTCSNTCTNYYPKVVRGSQRFHQMFLKICSSWHRTTGMVVSFDNGPCQVACVERSSHKYSEEYKGKQKNELGMPI